MGSFGANHEPVRFAFAEADRLSAALRATAAELEGQAASRRGWADLALREWRGIYAEQFRGDTKMGVSNASEFAAAMRQAATQLDTLARQARDEQTRRRRAAAWQAEHDSESRVEKIVDAIFGTGEKPPYMTPVAEPAPVVAQAPAAGRRSLS